MTVSIFILIIISVALSALAQITLKYGVNSNYNALNGDLTKYQLLWELLTNKYIVTGLFMYGCGAIIWLFVLSKLDVSKAYPFVGLGFILTMVLGCFILDETVNMTRIVGTMFVLLGVILVSKT
ncbi:EamA family transporter [Photobacterium sanguinicancri]|uniref:EamA family transporter n=1 Tax=Photobacterium sanguinicancri TaxID=875932 RepID=UPI0026E36392|nr:EamA family transporter [Photobacterium sanguinicancri]MDO6498662.1 EamA family transporter [Photobacterium sanguinicancri]